MPIQDTPPRPSTPSPSGAAPSLYERLGGISTIATVVDDLIDRIMVAPA
jgi:hypothetical protein